MSINKSAQLINLEAYDSIATKYHELTKDLDMKWQQRMFLDMIPENASILDAMSGPSRDVKEFVLKGYQTSAVDKSQPMLDIIQQEVPLVKVFNQDITKLDLKDTYDGIWCNAGIFMLEKKLIPKALEKISQHLKKGGALYINCKLGDKTEGSYYDKRYGVQRFETYFQNDELKELLENTNLDVRREMISYAQNPAYRTTLYEYVHHTNTIL